MRPGPASAVGVATLFVLNAGVLVLKPVGKSQLASEMPQIPVPGGGALFTVNVAEPVLPVSIVSMKRWFVVLTRLPVAVGVTFTVMTQEPFAATVPFENVIELEPAVAVSGGVPRPEVVAPFGFATTMFAGRLST